jgi:hypothetical protein
MFVFNRPVGAIFVRRQSKKIPVPLLARTFAAADPSSHHYYVVLQKVKPDKYFSVVLPDYMRSSAYLLGTTTTAPLQQLHPLLKDRSKGENNNNAA